MPSTSSNTSSGNAYINGVMWTSKWATNTLTYSFPTSGSFYGSGYPQNENAKGFEAFTATQQTATTNILKGFADVANLTFKLVTESNSVHGDLRYAETDVASTAWAYLPTSHPVGGDAWFNNSRNTFDNPVRGNYAWTAIIHETGHALGLKHPHESAGSFGAMPTDRDSMEYTVMSYRGYVGAPLTGFTNGSGSFAQTLMMYDIAALQKMYGANYSTNSGNTVYTWSPTTGQMFINGVGQTAPGTNKIFMTLWDGGGNDTYDFSNYTTGVTVNLDPGAWTTTSSTQLAALGGGKIAVGNIANALLYNNNTASLIENAIGSNAADTLTGNSANNVLTGRGGNDKLDGKGGEDTAAYSGASSNYSWVSQSDGSWKVSDLRSGSPDGTDILKNIEFLKFSDKTISLTGSAPPADPPPSEDPPPQDPPPSNPTPVNQMPIAAADTYVAARNKVLTVGKAGGVLANDRDPEGTTLTALLISGSNKGTVKLASDGSFKFTPAANFTGTTTFKYIAIDKGRMASQLATVTIKVTATGAVSGRTVASHDHGHDSYPAYVAGQPAAVDGPVPSITKMLAAAGAVVSTNGMLDKILAAVSDLGGSPTGHHAPIDVGADASSLPGFFSAYSSEFTLF